MVNIIQSVVDFFCDVSDIISTSGLAEAEMYILESPVAKKYSMISHTMELVTDGIPESVIY